MVSLKIYSLEKSLLNIIEQQEVSNDACASVESINDLEEVGRTAEHHTLFRNAWKFSFGDYFKRDAIKHAWTLLTDKRYFGLDEDRLWVTIFEEDDEAGDIWKEVTDIAPERDSEAR